MFGNWRRIYKKLRKKTNYVLCINIDLHDSLNNLLDVGDAPHSVIPLSHTKFNISRFE